MTNPYPNPQPNITSQALGAIPTYLVQDGVPVDSSNPLQITGGGGGGGSLSDTVFIDSTGTLFVYRDFGTGVPNAYSLPLWTLYSPIAPIKTTASILESTVYSAQQTVSLSATALSSESLSNGIIITADGDNSDIAYVGNSSLTILNGYKLFPGQSISYSVSNADSVYVIGLNTSDKIYITGN